MKIGDYVRTKDGVIATITDIIEDLSIDCDREVYDLGHLSMMEIPYLLKDRYIEKSSPDIIDLIKVGDFIGRDIVEEVKEFDDGTRVIVMADGFDEYQENEDFLEAGIVTKEQFESMEYRIGE